LHAVRYAPVAVTPSKSTSTDTPRHAVSSLDHLVTQWMSLVTVSAGSAVNSGHDHDIDDSTAPSIVNDQSSRCGRGVGPADSTGKSCVTYWPGGTRDGSTVPWRRPWNPREMGDIACSATLPVASAGVEGTHVGRPSTPAAWA